MIDFIVKYIKILLVYAMSAVQSLFGIYLLLPLVSDTEITSVGTYIFGLVLLVVSCLFVLWLRLGEIEYLFWEVIIEVVLAPIAVFRTVVSFLAWIIRRKSPELDFDFCSGFWDLLWCYLFHIG